ncbi:hypothetical protein HZR84_14310 [Hyphobacterium sp. CCMP332]|nr:hypothetical protein HZR84_14310 [Hyphobacterium sp. CCMP332]
MYGELRVGLSTSNYPGDFTVTGVSNFEGQIMANNESFFTDKVIIGDPLLIHSNQANTNSKLMIQGTGIFQEVVVDHVNEWNDEVFNKDYKLLELEEVESFINKNGHLPEVPKEAEVKENGYDLAKMDAILLKKIEELTLHLIALKKENEKLQTQLNNVTK